MVKDGQSKWKPGNGPTVCGVVRSTRSRVASCDCNGPESFLTPHWLLLLLANSKNVDRNRVNRTSCSIKEQRLIFYKRSVEYVSNETSRKQEEFTPLSDLHNFHVKTSNKKLSYDGLTWVKINASNTKRALLAAWGSCSVDKLHLQGLLEGIMNLSASGDSRGQQTGADGALRSL